MARPLRIEFPGAVYHVTSRGDRREPIVLGEEDREDLLGVLGQALLKCSAGQASRGLWGSPRGMLVANIRAVPAVYPSLA